MDTLIPIPDEKTFLAQTFHTLKWSKSKYSCFTVPEYEPIPLIQLKQEIITYLCLAPDQCRVLKAQSLLAEVNKLLELDVEDQRNMDDLCDEVMRLKKENQKLKWSMSVSKAK
jgi:hypothetical protein